MTIKLVYNNNSEDSINSIVEYIVETYPTINVEMYNEDINKQKKKAIMIKASCGASLLPFCSVYNEDKELIKAFYSEVKECTLINISNYLKL